MKLNPKMQKDESVFDRMAKMMISKLGMGGKKSKQKPDRSKNAGSNNHSKKGSKKRRLMAKKSRRINRLHAQKRHK